MKSWGPFAHRVDVLPFVLVVFVATAQLLLYVGTDRNVLRIIGMLLLWPVSAITIAIAHNHFHTRTFTRTWLNRVYEFVFFYQNGMPSYGWPLNHNIGHHRHFMNQDARAPMRDEYYWLERDGTVTPLIRYTLRTALLAYWYAVRNTKLRPDYRVKFAVVILLHAAVFAGLFVRDAPGALICFAFPVVLNMFTNAFFSYSHHAGLSLVDRYAASYTNVSRLGNLLTFNTGYHTAHHIRASVHWYLLPALHRAIADRIPKECYMSGKLTRRKAAAQLAQTRGRERASDMQKIQKKEACA